MAARSAQPVLEPDALAAAARTAGGGFPAQVFDELVRFLVEDGWLERRRALAAHAADERVNRHSCVLVYRYMKGGNMVAGRNLRELR